MNKNILLGLAVFSFPIFSWATLIDIECGTAVDEENLVVENSEVRLTSTDMESTDLKNWTLKVKGRAVRIKTLEINETQRYVSGYKIFVQLSASSPTGRVGTTYEFDTRKCDDENLASLKVVTVGGIAGGKSRKYACTCGAS